eukprot:179523-Amphidinium_carterae.1
MCKGCAGRDQVPIFNLPRLHWHAVTAEAEVIHSDGFGGIKFQCFTPENQQLVGTNRKCTPSHRDSL